MQITIKAYAKINLLLDVLGKRKDGYHEVEMIMQAISLYDEVILKPAEEISIKTNHPLVPDDESNLAYKAVSKIKEKFPFIPGVEIVINKNIPVEAGLAGGSTDGAAVILGLNRLFALKMTKEEMLDIASQLGSDVPFCLMGPTALAKGRGELLKEVAECPKLWLVLVKPDFGVRTPHIYKNLNISQINNHPDINAYILALEKANAEYICQNLNNVLELSTLKLYPQVSELKNMLQSKGAKHVLMSGSGPTVFAMFSNQESAQIFYEEIKGLSKDYQVFIAHTVTKNEIQERMCIYE